ncbi:hypothetical protein FMM05_03165 [Flavobacterium zepuense]|uniref:Uncharacterized protein n=1 Tax=Flavobacterium zepuense TaxID=2593302 RepID=A0A552V7F6_9FLAO|nr:hypothetical protein [Flavobacterium zepuense]TRW26394.1 hypothetical protein FMM05_03165 [Flavobacterium zepuense]
MIQPWIHKAKTDSLFILLPPFVILAVVFLCQPWLQDLEQRYSFYTWLFFVVFIDVAHVYATLFKTYLVPDAFREKKQLLIALPIICFFIGLLLFLLGSKVFWVTLAYVAVFHFIRQQYGFMRLYARFEPKTKFNIITDNLAIYAATGYPMLYWFMSPPRQFAWFMQDEFFTYQNAHLLQAFGYLYYLILGIYVIKVTYGYSKHGYFNIPKNAIVFGTAASWYFGIVYFNNDLIFTMLNIVSHGIPYMALVYLKEIKQAKAPATAGIWQYLNTHKGIIIYVGILVALAFSEEYLWEILVWNEQFSLGSITTFEAWQFLLVPLLVVPQFTHYILDGFIWKTKKA